MRREKYFSKKWGVGIGRIVIFLSYVFEKSFFVIIRVERKGFRKVRFVFLRK